MRHRGRERWRIEEHPGDGLVAALQVLLPLITQLTQFLTAHPAIIQAVIVAWTALAIALGPLASIIGAISTVIGGLFSGLGDG